MFIIMSIHLFDKFQKENEKNYSSQRLKRIGEFIDPSPLTYFIVEIKLKTGLTA